MSFRLANISLKPRLIGLCLAIGLVPLALSAAVAFVQANRALSDARNTSAAALKQQVGDQLSAIRDVKKSSIERYFQTIHDQVASFSEDPSIAQAIVELNQSFDKVREQNQINAEKLTAMREEVLKFYRSEFSAKYQTENDGAHANADAFVAKLDDNAIALQHAYIVSNPFPLGQKHRLDRGSDKSQYSAAHAKHHPFLRGFLEKFGYYDIFLTNTRGEVVYSCFKEIDFSTSL
ncbi:MAG: hypothetical protein JNM18_23425, partial [Planctomycetaceae bacterium]|nr:hypothetical protein [Planctomycetaceae bacterium]